MTHLHLAAGLVGVAAALAGFRTSRAAAAVMTAAMAQCLLAACGLAVPFLLTPVLTLAGWGAAWAAAAAARRSGVPSPVPVDLMATVALLWWLPASSHAPSLGGAHLHATAGVTGLPAVLVAAGWLVAAARRPRVCGLGMAGSMLVTALLTSLR
ncbi:hypothetical protein AB1207_20180 [Kineococcus endophyticus]|uniref:Integral membrane protein n=1 Tax=Kineococcus endophyticus TaxID=1181883 RepID=A0ABV3PBT7_9ACTN